VLDDDRDDASLPLGTSSVEPSSSTDLPGRTPPAGDTEVLEVDLSSVEAALAAAAPVERRLHSDPHDFAGLYIRHRSSFTLHARRYLRDGRDADEVVQEAFLRLFLALPELETELQALAYCRRTITNLCIDRYRAQARRPSLVDLDSVSPEDLADDEPADPVVQAEDAALVREAMSLLSPLHRAALVKREIEEKPLPVIAQELDIPEESVKHLLFRARRALRRLLAGTSLAPGSDHELAGGLARAAKAGSGGMAGFLLLLALSLGTGPDLRAIPVVGTDLPDLIPVTSPATDKAPMSPRRWPPASRAASPRRSAQR
jgi:RNA polymerase sigma-70 factor (ECF subfamily)